MVIAAFLILSVLTAYNIKIGNADGGKSDNKTKTETTEKSNDVIGPVSGMIQVQQQIQRIPQRIMIWMWSRAEGQNGLIH